MRSSSRRFPDARPGTPDGACPPDGLPEPRPYGHLDPREGACLMEAASVLGTGSFTDSPPGTHPALAALARVVNDTAGARERRDLWPLAADLARAYPADRSYGPRLIADVVHEARDVRPTSRVLALREARCARRARLLAPTPAGPGPGRISRARDTAWWRGPGRHHLEHALRVLLRAPDARGRLGRLLRTEIARAKAAPAPDGPVPATR